MSLELKVLKEVGKSVRQSCRFCRSPIIDSFSRNKGSVPQLL